MKRKATQCTHPSSLREKKKHITTSEGAKPGGVFDLLLLCSSLKSRARRLQRPVYTIVPAETCLGEKKGAGVGSCILQNGKRGCHQPNKMASHSHTTSGLILYQVNLCS